MTAHSIAEVTKRFGPLDTELLLGKVSLEVSEGQVIALLEMSGCGKTGKYNRETTAEGAREQIDLVHPELLEKAKALL